MTQIKVMPSKIGGSVTVPPSKSHTLRAILFASMAEGVSAVNNYLQSPDASAMIAACQQLGAEIIIKNNTLQIRGCAGKPKTPSNIIDSGNSGQVLRFIAAIVAHCPNYTVITGDESIRTNRPIQPLLDALQQLNVFAVSTKNDGYAPIIIKGPLIAGKTKLDGADSQPVSGMLMAAAFAEGESTILVTNSGEKPWIDLTLSWFDRLGIAFNNNNYEHYIIPGGARINAFEYTVPSDFSSLAFPVAGALLTNSEITVTNVDMRDVQGDKQLIYALQKLGANIIIEDAEQTLTVKPNSQLVGTTLDINDYIDAITILAVVACFAEGETRITGAAIARKKECDRIHAIATELTKMGADISETPDGLIIKKSQLKGAKLQTYHDHRMVMSLTVAALAAKGESNIDGVGVVAKSFPGFVEAMQTLGANIEFVS